MHSELLNFSDGSWLAINMIIVLFLNRTMYTYILLFLSVLLSMASANTPGDEHSFCTDTVINDNEITPPQYPSNVKILMDSYNYIDLLPPHTQYGD